MTEQIPKGSGETSQLYPCVEVLLKSIMARPGTSKRQQTARCQRPVFLNKLDTPSSPGNAKVSSCHREEKGPDRIEPVNL